MLGRNSSHLILTRKHGTGVASIIKATYKNRPISTDAPLTRWSGLISLGMTPTDIVYPLKRYPATGHNVRCPVAFLPQTQNLNLIMRDQTGLSWGTRNKIPDQYSSSEQNRGGKTELSQIGRHEGDVTTKCCVGSSTASQNRKMALEEKQMKPK